MNLLELPEATVWTSLRGKHRADRTICAERRSRCRHSRAFARGCSSNARCGTFWQVPLDAYPRLEQGGIILKSSKNLETARAFRDFVLGAHGREVLKLYGFRKIGQARERRAVRSGLRRTRSSRAQLRSATALMLADERQRSGSMRRLIFPGAPHRTLLGEASEDADDRNICPKPVR
jgi:hypothetical protein